MEDPTTEESGQPIPPRTNGNTADAVTLVPPPLSLEQAQKLADAIKALEDLIESLGTVGGAMARFLLGKLIQGLKAMGPVPLTPLPGTQPSTPPSTTP